jgi:outer membrane lipoprotein SlyB
MEQTMHKTIRWPLALFIVAGTALGGCAANRPVADAPISHRSVQDNAYGRVQNIEVVAAEQRGPGAGAVLGAVIGGLVGNQIGGGSGKAAATGVGVVGGAIVGHQIQKRRADDVYRVSVRLDNGAHRSFDYRTIGDLRVGDRVRIENGQLHDLS